MPENAKITTPAVLRIAEVLGMSCQVRFDGCTNAAPTSTNAISGNSLAIVTTSIIRALRCTPRMLMNASIAMTRSSNGVISHSGRDGINAITDRVKSTATAAPAASPVKNWSTPATNPMNGPSATST